MTLKVVEVDASLATAWQAFCDARPDTLIYYSWKFREFLRHLLDCQPMYRAAFDSSGQIQGILPLMAIDGPHGTVMNSLPFFGSNGGILATTEGAKESLLSAYHDLLDLPGLAASAIIGNPLDTTNNPVRHCFTDSRIGQVTYLDFADDPGEELLGKLDAAARRNVRKAWRKQFEITIENDALPILADIHRENMAAIGGRMKPDKFFELIPKFFEPGTDWNLYTARLDRNISAALLVFYNGTTADYYMPAVRLTARPNQPTAAVLYRALLDAHARGCTLWNWGGTWLSQTGVLRFKRKWGAEDKPYEYYVHLGNDALLNLSSNALVDAYGFFYTIPFNRLRP